MATKVQEKAAEAEELTYRLFPSTRLVLVALVGIGGGLMLVTRFNVTIAVLCMVHGTGDPPPADALMTSLEDAVETSLEDGAGNRTGGAVVWEGNKLEETADAGQGEFAWDKTFQGQLLSSYFYGYTASLVPAGWVADKMPPVVMLLLGISSQGLCTLAFPVVARTNAYLLLALRAFQGVCCAVILPSASIFVRNWSVPVEYATVFGICWAIQYFFGGITHPVASSICQAGGWPLVFYVTGALPLLWAVLAWFLITSSPDESSVCSEDEKRFLASKRLCRAATVKSLSDKDVKREHTPLLAILTNRQVLIVVGTFFSHSWLYYALIITLPMFLKETMDVNLTENGFLSGLPTNVMAIGVLAGGKVFHHLLTRWQCSRTNARKIMATVSLLVPAALLGAILLLPPGMKYLTVSLLVLCNVTSVLCVSGGPMSAGPEIAPQFAGVIWGLAGSIGNLPGILAPTVSAAMTPNKTLQEWRYFFLIAVILSVAMDVIILLFWKSEVQPFARSQKEEEKTPDENTCEA